MRSNKAVKAHRESEREIKSRQLYHQGATEDETIDWLKEDEPSWQNVFMIADSTLETEELYYTKRKAKDENQEVAYHRSRLRPRDSFCIFGLNDKNMKGKSTFVFKSSRIQIQ